MDGCDGLFGTMRQAIEELGTPRLKSTRPIHSYRGQITLGNPEQYDSAMCIDVERYPRVMVRRPLTASNYVQRTDSSNGHASTESSNTVSAGADGLEGASAQIESYSLAGIQNSRIYQVVDGGIPNAKRDVNREDLAKGYEYGRTAVHISESDQNVTKLETQAALEIIGFVPWTTVWALTS